MAIGQDTSAQRVAIITGAAQGIGKAIAIRLARDGHKVVLNDLERQATLLEEVRSQIKNDGGQALVKTGDVSVEEDVIRLVDWTVSECGSLDIMVANAVPAGTLEDIDKMFSVNVNGTFLCYKYAALQMIKQGRGGRIIGAASICGKQALTKASLYSASKFAVRGLTQALAGELGKYNITVNAYAPGATDTNMLRELLSNRLRIDGIEPPPGTIKSGTGHLGRDSKPEDIAGIVSFFASKDSAMITGQSINVNGGAVCD
ncbi:acetoin reductase family protein [Panaeolus papilionaceus]|nr:acetoin reductase family protein [Panaeolus papilionaceus]